MSHLPEEALAANAASITEANRAGGRTLADTARRTRRLALASSEIGRPISCAWRMFLRRNISIVVVGRPGPINFPFRRNSVIAYSIPAQAWAQEIMREFPRTLRVHPPILSTSISWGCVATMKRTSPFGRYSASMPNRLRWVRAQSWTFNMSCSADLRSGYIMRVFG